MLRNNSNGNRTEISWINAQLNSNNMLDLNQLDCIRNFVLFWNLFEGQICNCYANPTTLQSVASELARRRGCNLGIFLEYLSYFQNRYIDNGRTNQAFLGLEFRDNDKKEVVEKVILGLSREPEDIILSLLLIIYRLRNNLFHGIKKIEILPNQVDNFKVANSVIMAFVDQWKS